MIYHLAGRHPLTSTAALLLTVALMTGCMGGSAPTTTTSADTDPVATYPGSTDGGMDGLLSGTLRLRDGCLLVEAPDGSAIIPVFAADQVSWHDGVLTWMDQRYSVDTQVSFGGGGGSPSGIEDIPEACPNEDVWLVGN